MKPAGPGGPTSSGPALKPTVGALQTGRRSHPPSVHRLTPSKSHWTPGSEVKVQEDPSITEPGYVQPVPLQLPPLMKGRLQGSPSSLQVGVWSKALLTHTREPALVQEKPGFAMKIHSDPLATLAWGTHPNPTQMPPYMVGTVQGSPYR